MAEVKHKVSITFRYEMADRGRALVLHLDRHTAFALQQAHASRSVWQGVGYSVDMADVSVVLITEEWER